ncbi:hypothetical protein GGS23DRAFT_594961 [Durotheca rogersii]|uniref:uncharacterized protein n=1 Tax=Durotheca rogersii TaxID=419775 RepID=UPI00221F59F1|nr:uncharacterized protein GGS23DRAFT_594961 [Durotheca rogersii]KAI5865435.1 hypothetical protein GGS23DRAFT_594961 [Durotheca rogersii]
MSADEIERDDALKFNFLFRAYRQRGEIVNRAVQDSEELRAQYAKYPLLSPSRIGDHALVGEQDPATQRRYQDFTNWFGGDAPHLYRLQKQLGVGGNGIAVHYKYFGRQLTNPQGFTIPDFAGQDIVVKFPLAGWSDENVFEETRLLKIEPADIGKTVMGYFPEQPSDDSSAAEASSGDESDTSARRQIRQNRLRPRSQRTVRELKSKRRKRRAHVRAMLRERVFYPQPDDRREFVVLEYLENGNIDQLIAKLVEDTENGGRIPNRVLWAFWLCLVRGCVAMEYPPRKFHPMRKRPETPPRGSIPLNSREMEAVRDSLRSARIRVHDAGELEAKRERYRQQAGDLIETVPAEPNAQRRQNLVHFDIDPQNILVDGLELDAAGLREWYSARSRAERNLPRHSPPSRDVNHTHPRPDRAQHEHHVVPRLKLADFGLADVVKRPFAIIGTAAHLTVLKAYTIETGDGGEQFSMEWDFHPLNPGGSELADSDVAGNYGPWTNIWQIALVMWSLITKMRAPTPPQPQVPADLLPLIGPAIEDKHQTANFMGKKEYAMRPISYCPLLCDPRTTEYDWVDEPLRRCLYACMYHRPADRPTLEQLLDEATHNAAREFDGPGEDDAAVRDWVYKWFYSPPPYGNADHTTGPGGGGKATGKAAAKATGKAAAEATGKATAKAESKTGGEIQGDGGGGATAAYVDAAALWDSMFPHGWQTVENYVSYGRCGSEAIRDSMRALFGDFIDVGGEPVPIPENALLVGIFHDLVDAGLLATTGRRPGPSYGATSDDELVEVLTDWAVNAGLELQLGIMGGDAVPYLMPTPFANPHVIWIRHYGNHWAGVRGLDG